VKPITLNPTTVQSNNNISSGSVTSASNTTNIAKEYFDHTNSTLSSSNLTNNSDLNGNSISSGALPPLIAGRRINMPLGQHRYLN
jgi:hypothetical protein